MTFDDETDDGALLRGYCERGAGDAFEILVHRYAGMVCGVAERVTGRRMLAEEVTQNVFASLARKAHKLQGQGGRLAGWLHRAAVLEARHVLRGEKRHERRVRAASEEQIEETGDNGQLRAEVDSALNDLAPADRDVLVWRYYNGLSFREIAARLGKTEAAAQKQGRRALDKLGVNLRGLGVAVPALAITTMLATGMSEALPAAIVTKIGAAAITAGGGNASGAGISLIGAGKLLLAGGAAAVLLAIIIHQGSVLATERDRLESADSNGVVPPAPLSALQVRDFTVDVSYRSADEVDLHALAEDLYRGARLYDHERSLRAAATLAGLEGLSGDDLKALFARATGSRLTPQRRRFLLAKLAPLVGKRDPAWLLDFCFPKAAAGRSQLWVTADGPAGSPLPAMMTIWVERDPAAVASWFERALAENRFGAPRTAGLQQEMEGVLRTMALSVSAGAWSKAQVTVEGLLLGLPRKVRGDVLRSLPDKLPDDASLASFATSPVVRDERFKQAGIVHRIGSRFKDREWAETENFATRIGGGREGRQFLARVAAQRWRFEEGEVAAGVDAMLAWAQKAGTGKDTGYLVGAALGTQEFLGQDDTWAQAKRVAGELGHGEEVLASYLVHAVGPTHPMRLLKLAVAELRDPVLRSDVGYAAVVYMYDGEFKAGELKAAGFTEAEVELVRGRFEE